MKCRLCSTARIDRKSGIGRPCVRGLGRHGECQSRCQFGDTACLGRRQVVGVFESRLPGLLVLALSDQAGQVKHRLANRLPRRQGVLENQRGLLEHALVGQRVGATCVGIGEAMGPFRPRIQPGQLLEDLHRFLEAALAQSDFAAVGKNVRSSRQRGSAKWLFLHCEVPVAKVRRTRLLSSSSVQVLHTHDGRA